MKLTISALLVGTAAATSATIRADSKVGKKLLHRARRLDGDDAEMSWATGYSLKFEQCVTTTDYYGGYFGGNQDNNNDNNNNYNGVYEQRLVHFKLCPTDACGSGSCDGGASYVLDMNVFVQAYMEWKVEADEQECEYVAANCYCENANDDDVSVVFERLNIILAPALPKTHPTVRFSLFSIGMRGSMLHERWHLRSVRRARQPEQQRPRRRRV